jgi:hypothetical protein
VSNVENMEVYVAGEQVGPGESYTTAQSDDATVVDLDTTF